MGRNTIRFVIVLATISVLGILLIQFFFIKNTVDLNEKKFHDATTQALKNVASLLIEYNNKLRGTTNPHEVTNEIEQISSNYYVVNVNDEINPYLLHHFLIMEFKRFNINLDFEYAIYDCERDQMVYGMRGKERGSQKHQSVKEEQDPNCNPDEELPKTSDKNKHDHNLPTCKKYTYYFGVYFPNRSRYYSNRIHPWYVIDGILFIVILFFGYTLYVILKQRKLSEIQKNFINNLTHEFKTPIASIDLSAKVLSDPGIVNQPKRLQEYSKIVKEQTQRLSDQVEKVLQMASIEKQKMVMEKEKTELVSFIQKCIIDFKNSQTVLDYQIDFEAPEPPVIIMADQLHFSNVIFNLLDNAFKYCQDKPEITITISGKEKNTKLSIADHGIGIPRKYRKKIFGRFFRVPTGNVHNVKGFGLGLDYVKKITKRHGWSISVSDNSPQGTIFTVTIPN